MNLFFKYITIIGGIIILGLFGNFIFKYLYYGYSSDFETQKKYEWIFKQSYLTEFDNLGSASYNRFDVFNDYHYKGDYTNNDMGIGITVWEFKNQSNLSLNNISLNNRTNLYNVLYSEYQTINSGSKLEVNVQYGYSFENGIKVYIDDSDTIKSFYKNSKYKGFYGNFRKISLSNRNGESQILFHNDLKSSLTSMVFYKKLSSLYVIVFNSEKHFDKDVIKMLNLNY